MKNNNKLNAVKTWLTRMGVIGAIAAMSFGASCKHDDPVTPPTPEPEPTPVIPTKEITLNWTWNDFNTGDILSKDTVKKYADMEDVKFVFLNIVNEDNGGWSSTFSARVFHMAADSLQPRFDISNKVRGSGTIFVSENGGAQLSNPTGNGTGMAASDSTKFANWGYGIKRYNPSVSNGR